MDSTNALFVEVERNDNSKKVKFENTFYNIINGEKISTSQRLSVINPATGKQLAAVPDVDRAWLNRAIGDARNAFPAWSAAPFGSRKAILASLLNKIDEHADELSSLLAAEQGGLVAQARWEIDLLTKAFGPALMQMEQPAKEQDAQPMEHITKRYVPIDVSNAISPWRLPVILSLGQVLPALLAGDTVVLRPSPFTPLTVLRISEYIRELLPPGVLNVVTGGHDLWPWVSAHSGIDLITFTRSTHLGKHPLESAVGELELGGNDSSAVAHADPEKIAFFGSIVLVPVNWKPGRFGLASTLFEILSFRPVRMRTQVLVWRLARKASHFYPVFRYDLLPHELISQVLI
ncbi:MAG TPA: aldehyde dehydrogenase family protein [Chthoniobacterales bacterium]|nr:aldehyde dehydrogenase family protein [Chthoniobacterales bacterium]